MSVVLIHLGRKRRLALDRVREQTFRRELTRVRREPPSKTPLPKLAAPDCRIEVAGAGAAQKRAYQLVGQSILVELATGRRWRFPLGVELMVWLNEDTWP